MLARRVREQQQRQRGPKSLFPARPGSPNASARARPHRPYEFGVKVSVATTIDRAKGDRAKGRPVRHHVKSMPGNPYDGHTLATVIPQMEALVGNTLDRILADKGYRGHCNRPITSSGVFISGQKRASHLRSNASCAAGSR